MKRNVGRAWVDMGPASPIPVGPLGERHSRHDHRPNDSDYPTGRGHTFAVKGHIPMQFPVRVDDIELHGN
jgi:hypothetical protein